MASFAARSVFSRLAAIPTKHPFAFGVGLSCVKTSFSDLLVQTVVERKEKIDWRRNAAFGAFGFVYLGCVQYSIYVSFFGRLFPNAARFAAKPFQQKLKDFRGMLNMGAQVFLDQCIHHPFAYFPAFYCTKELVMSDKPDLVKVLNDYRQNFKEDLLALWKIWVPAMVVNFTFMPMWARIPFVAGVSLLWTCVLSAMRGGDVAHGEEMVGGAVTGASLHLLEEGVNEIFYNCPVELDKNMSHVMLSASGPDKVGWVAILSRAISDLHGNVTHSKMVRLGQEFIILMHVSVRPEDQKDLIKKLNNCPDLKPLNIRTTSLTRRNTGSYSTVATGVRIHAVGEDRPGILASMSEKIAEKGMSIDNVSTELRMNRKSGKRNFVVTADCSSEHKFDESDISDLVTEFSTLKQHLDLDVVDVRIQRMSELKKRVSQATGS